MRIQVSFKHFVTFYPKRATNQPLKIFDLHSHVGKMQDKLMIVIPDTFD